MKPVVGSDPTSLSLPGDAHAESSALEGTSSHEGRLVLLEKRERPLEAPGKGRACRLSPGPGGEAGAGNASSAEAGRCDTKGAGEEAEAASSDAGGDRERREPDSPSSRQCPFESGDSPPVAESTLAGIHERLPALDSARVAAPRDAPTQLRAQASVSCPPSLLRMDEASKRSVSSLSLSEPGAPLLPTDTYDEPPRRGAEVQTGSSTSADALVRERSSDPSHGPRAQTRRAFWPPLVALVLGSLLGPWMSSPGRFLASRSGGGGSGGGGGFGAALRLVLRRSHAALTRRLPNSAAFVAPSPVRAAAPYVALTLAVGWLAPAIAGAAERRRRRLALWNRLRRADTYGAWRDAAEALLEADRVVEDNDASPRFGDASGVGTETGRNASGCGLGDGQGTPGCKSPSGDLDASGGRTASGPDAAHASLRASASSRRARQLLDCALALDVARERNSVPALQSLLLSQARPCATACAREAALACDAGRVLLAPPACVREYERAWRMGLCWLLDCAGVPWRVGVEGVSAAGDGGTVGVAGSGDDKNRAGRDLPSNALPSASSSALSLSALHAFLSLLSHRLGSTALVLSGGGSFGHFHFGVVRALADLRCVPRVASGSSAGSFGASLLCSRSPREIQALGKAFPGPIDLEVLHRAPDTSWAGDLLKALRGLPVKDDEPLRRSLRVAFGDLTLAEAQKRSGRRLAVTVSPSAGLVAQPRLLQALAAPDVLVRSAVAASCAFPMLFKAQPLLCKRGSGVSVGVASGCVLEVVEELAADRTHADDADGTTDEAYLSAEDGLETPRGCSRDSDLRVQSSFETPRSRDPVLRAHHAPPRPPSSLHSPAPRADRSPLARGSPLTSNVVAAPMALLKLARGRTQRGGESGEGQALEEEGKRAEGGLRLASASDPRAPGAETDGEGDEEEEEEDGGAEGWQTATPSSAVPTLDCSEPPAARCPLRSPPLRVLSRSRVSHRNLATAAPRSPPLAPHTPTVRPDSARVPELWARSPGPRARASPGASPLSHCGNAVQPLPEGSAGGAGGGTDGPVHPCRGRHPPRATSPGSLGADSSPTPRRRSYPPPSPFPSGALPAPLFEHPHPPAEDLWRDGSLELDIPIAALAGSLGVSRTIVSQVNPWALPLLAARKVGGRAVASELRLRGRQASLLAPAGKGGGLGGAARLVGAFLNQPWEGDVTVALPPTLLAPHRAATNLSGAEKLIGVAEARHLTWTRGAAAIAAVMLEQSLEEAVRRVEREMERERCARKAEAEASGDEDAPLAGTARGDDAEIQEAFHDASPLYPARPHTSLSYPARFAGNPRLSPLVGQLPRPHTSLSCSSARRGGASDAEVNGNASRNGDGENTARGSSVDVPHARSFLDPARSPLFSTSRPPPASPGRLFVQTTFVQTGSVTSAGASAVRSPSRSPCDGGSEPHALGGPSSLPLERVPLWRQGAKATLPCPELPLGWSPRWSDAEADERMKECGWGSVRTLAQAPWDYDRTVAVHGWEDQADGKMGEAPEGSSEEPTCQPLGPPTAQEQERANIDARALAEAAQVIRGDVWDP